MFFCGARARNRTGDLFVTSEMLCQLSYSGVYLLPTILPQLQCHSQTSEMTIVSLPTELLWRVFIAYYLTSTPVSLANE